MLCAVQESHVSIFDQLEAFIIVIATVAMNTRRWKMDAIEIINPLDYHES